MTPGGEPATDRPQLRIGVLISGAGSTLQNLVERIGAQRLPGVNIAVVISSRAEVRGVEVARAAGLPLEIIRRRDFPDDRSFSAALTRCLRAHGVELVVFGGFLCYWHVPVEYAGRTLNIHPALLPGFGGRGMHGRHVHEAVLAAGATESGCTVHVVDEEYDHGPIVAQRRVPVLPGDSPETLAARVAEQERELYPAVLQRIAEEGLDWLTRASGRGVPLNPQ
jgi:phosphoribosylglycinamide formyltransferase-1